MQGKTNGRKEEGEKALSTAARVRHRRLRTGLCEEGVVQRQGVQVEAGRHGSKEGVLEYSKNMPKVLGPVTGQHGQGMMSPETEGRAGGSDDDKVGKEEETAEGQGNNTGDGGNIDGDDEEWVGQKPKQTGGGNNATQINPDELVKEEDACTFFSGYLAYASANALSFLYKLEDDVVAGSETHLGRKETLKMLKGMRREGDWRDTVSCGYRNVGRPGLSAGVLVAVKKGVSTMTPEADHEGITGDPRMCTIILKGETRVVLISEELEASGMLSPSGLALVRPERHSEHLL